MEHLPTSLLSPESPSPFPFPFDPLKKFQIQSFISQQLIGKLQSQVIRKFSKLHESSLDNDIHRQLNQTKCDVDRFLTLIIQQLQMNLDLAHLSFISQPFKRILSFTNNLLSVTLSHLNRSLLSLNQSQSLIQTLKTKSTSPLPETLGIINQHQLLQLRRLQAQQQQRQKYQSLNSQDFLRQLQNILKHQIYQQNWKTPATTGELIDIKERMEEICNFTERISLSSLKTKIEMTGGNDQLLMENNQLVQELTKDIQGRFQDLFKGHYYESIMVNSRKIWEKEWREYKEGLVAKETQTPDTVWKKPKEIHHLKEIEHKNKVIEGLTNRTNLYEKRIEENKCLNLRNEEEIQKYKMLCDELARKQQEMHDSIRQNSLYNTATVTELRQEIRLRDTSITKLTNLLESGGIKVSISNCQTQCDKVEYQSVDVQTEDGEREENEILVRVFERHMKGKAKKRMSMGAMAMENMSRYVGQKKRGIGRYLVGFLEYLAEGGMELLGMVVERLEEVEYGVMKKALERMFKENNADEEDAKHQQKETQKQKKIYVDTQTQTLPQPSRPARAQKRISIKNAMKIVVQQDLPLFNKIYSSKSSIRSAKSSFHQQSNFFMNTNLNIRGNEEAVVERMSTVLSLKQTKKSLVSSKRVKYQNVDGLDGEREEGKVLKNIDILENISRPMSRGWKASVVGNEKEKGKEKKQVDFKGKESSILRSIPVSTTPQAILKPPKKSEIIPPTIASNPTPKLFTTKPKISNTFANSNPINPNQPSLTSNPNPQQKQNKPQPSPLPPALKYPSLSPANKPQRNLPTQPTQLLPLPPKLSQHKKNSHTQIRDTSNLFEHEFARMMTEQGRSGRKESNKFESFEVFEELHRDRTQINLKRFNQGREHRKVMTASSPGELSGVAKEKERERESLLRANGGKKLN